MKPILISALFSFYLCIVSGESLAKASTDDYLRCGLMYGALFKVAKDSSHTELISHVQPRLEVVFPFIADNASNPKIKERFKEITRQLNPEIEKLLVALKDTLNRPSPQDFRKALKPVLACDSVFGISSSPLSSLLDTDFQSDPFASGAYEGCLAKQRQNPGPYSDANLRQYCGCVATSIFEKGINARASKASSTSAFQAAHAKCFAELS
jgi:hypothetical protein